MQINQQRITVTLANADQWAQLFPNMEMSTRGNHIFPELKFIVSGMSSEEPYELRLNFKMLDNVRVALAEDGESYVESTKRFPLENHETEWYCHPKGVQSGSEWMKEPVDFNGCKLVNNQKDVKADNYLFINTMHRYIPVVTVFPSDILATAVFEFPEAQFVPVSVYKSKKVKEWKCANNKYTTNANGGKGQQLKRRKRKASDGQETQIKRRPLEEKNSPVHFNSQSNSPINAQYPVVPVTDNSPFNYSNPNFQYPVSYENSPCDFNYNKENFQYPPATDNYYNYSTPPVQYPQYGMADFSWNPDYSMTSGSSGFHSDTSSFYQWNQ